MEVSTLKRTCRLERHESASIQYITPWWWMRAVQYPFCGTHGFGFPRKFKFLLDRLGDGFCCPVEKNMTDGYPLKVLQMLS